MKKGNKLVLVGGVALCLVLVGLATQVIKAKTEVVSSALCPSQYPTAEAATASFQKFINDFYDTHPGASLGDVMSARHDFYVSHNCTEELAAYKQYQEGKADPATVARIDSAIQGH